MPLALFAFGLSGVSLMGLPPSGGFSAKWLLLQSALASGQWHWAVALIGGGALTAGYVFRVLSASFKQGTGDKFDRTPLGWDLVSLLLAAGAIVVGVVATGPLAVLRIGAPVAGVTP